MRDDDDHLRLECDGVIRKRSKKCIQMQACLPNEWINNARWILLFSARNTCDTNPRTSSMGYSASFCQMRGRKKLLPPQNVTSGAEGAMVMVSLETINMPPKTGNIHRACLSAILGAQKSAKLVSSLLWLPEYMQHQSTNMHVLPSLTTWYYAHRIFLSG